MKKRIYSLILILFLSNYLFAQSVISPGAENIEEYIPHLKGKKIGVIANQTSMVRSVHLVDTLLSLGIEIVRIFSPEHGFRGQSEAGEFISHSIDEKTKLPIHSLYGKKKQLQDKDLEDIDILLFDIQDVGARFYTYLSTLHYVMQSCAQHNKLLIVLDRPNPNGFYIDGPVLDLSCSSFVGMHPVPIVYGMTIAEYALMINGQDWLGEHLKCPLQYVKIRNYTHDSLYTIPIPPSPNLQNMNAVYLYPGLCWFEGTSVSVGRGTPKPFEMIGSPYIKQTPYFFTPKTIKGVSENPPYLHKLCYGFDLSAKGSQVLLTKKLQLEYLIMMYQLSPQETFFIPFFDKLAGITQLKEQIKSGKTADEIRKSWTDDIRLFKLIRKKYLLYDDFK